MGGACIRCAGTFGGAPAADGCSGFEHWSDAGWIHASRAYGDARAWFTCRDRLAEICCYYWATDIS